jgi:hypothetical protein
MPKETTAPRRTSSAKKPAQATPTAQPADPAVAHWMDFFQRYHQAHDIRLIALSLRPEPVPVTETQSSRYVFEVGVKRGEDGEDRYILIAWEIDVPGIRMRDCESLQDAMERFESRNIYGKGVATVRLRPEFRPF